MLKSMQQPSQTAESAPAHTFAGLIADFAVPEKKFPPAREPLPLEEDVATISYEQVLRSRNRALAEPSETTSLAPAQAASQEPQASLLLSPSATAGKPSPRATRSSSVTIRLSAQENQQMHLMAAEAGMTISDYLRSCVFEVESLRAQVKAALARLNAESEAPAPSLPPAGPRRWQSLWCVLKRPRLRP